MQDQTPCRFLIDFRKINLEKPSSTNWIFAGFTGSKNTVRNRLKIQFIELDFSKLIFQKSSTDQQGARLFNPNLPPQTSQPRTLQPTLLFWVEQFMVRKSGVVQNQSLYSLFAPNYMEQKLRFGLVLGRLAVLENKFEPTLSNF